MTAADLLRRLDDLGVGLTLVGDRIRYRSTGADLAPELVAEMKDHRDELVALLADRSAPAWPPAGDTAAGTGRRGPLTTAQRELWATSYLVEDGTYNLCGGLRLRGELDVAAMRAALADVHRRHPSLRTTFPVENGEPHQHVLPAAAPALTEHDDTGTYEECLAACARLAAEALPLTDSPPVRTHLFPLGPDDHVLFVVLHHIVADGVSVAVLLADVAHCYGERVAGRPAPPRTGPDMVDYARHEHALRGSARDEPDRRGGESGALPLPPPARATGDARQVTATVDAATTAAVRGLVARSRASVFVVVAAAIGAALSRYTGRADLVVGMPVARRNLPGLDTLVGLLLDMVPVPLDLGGGTTFPELVRRTRAAVLGAASRPGAAPAAPFTVVLTDAGTALPAPEFPGLSATLLDVDREGAKFGLNFLVRDDGDTIAIDVELDPGVIARPDVVAMTGMVRRILAQGTAHPVRRVADLAAAPFGEAAGGAFGAPAPSAPGDDETLVSRLARVAAARGDATAITHGGDSVSYAEFMRRAEEVAGGLRARGHGPGDVVAVALPRGVDLVVALVGVMAAGAAYLVLDDRWPPARVDDVLADAGVRTTVAREPGPGRVTLAALTAPAERVLARTADATAYVIYTSGSTGTPKGVHVSHRNVLSLLDATADRFAFGAGDTWTSFHACSFDFSVWEVFGCLTHGGRLVVVPAWCTREPDAFARLLRDEGVTVLNQTPSALSVTLPAMARTPGAAARLRYVVFGGEVLARGLVDAWYAAMGTGTELVNMYGITETTVHASWRWCPPTGVEPESDIGGPLPGGALHVLHDNGSPVLNRCVGEIYVGGPQVSTGYVGRPRETALRFVPDPFAATPGARLYRSGDLGRRNGTGIAYLGRRDSQVQVNGFRVELAEIEAALTAVPGVAAAGAAATEDGSGAHLLAVVVGATGPKPSTSEVLRAVRVVLPRYLVPHRIAVVAALPLTANGKLDRAAVVRLASARDRDAGPAPAPLDGPVQTLLAELYGTVLGCPPASSATDFFDSGGDSMRAINLVALAGERGLRFTVRDLYEAPTVGALATRAVPGVVADTGPPAPFALLPDGAAATLPPGVEDAYPMTALQAGMIYHQELAPGSGVYHIVLSYRVRGVMDPAAFRVAAQALTDAHPVLRTSFDVANTHGPLQRVHTGVAVPLSFEDVSALPEAEQEARVGAVVDRETAAEFDLTRAPLFRLVVLTRSAEDYQLVFAHNHAMVDGWSVNAFFADLNARYRDALAGTATAPPAPRTTFADYVALERRALADPAHRDHWRDLGPAGAGLVAPDRSGTPVMRQLRVDLPDDIRTELRAVAAGVGVPLKALLLAAHVRVLAWLSGADDVVTSLVVSCRPETPDADRVLGLFLNQLPLRVRLADQSWADLARQAHRAELDLVRHRWFPMAEIQRRHGTRPVFDTGFNFTDFHTTQRLVRDGGVEVVDIDEREATHYAYGANYTVDVRTRELRLILEHDASAVPAGVVALAADAHRAVLAAVLADVDASHRALALPGAVAVARRAGTPPDATPATAAPAAAEDAPAPPGPVVDEVRAVWTEVLGVTDVDTSTSFFDVGGSSLTAMQVVSRLRARFGPLSMGAFMAAPTIAAVASALGSTAPPARPTPATEPVAAPRRYPLSRAQHQMWLISTKLPGVPLFGMPGALVADGPLDRAVLDATFAALVRRHDALRTRVEVTDGGPELVVEPDVAHRTSVAFVDVSDAADPEGRAEALVAAAAREPIPLDTAPLMRVVVHRVGPERHVLHLNVHHLVCDGWSLRLLLADAVRAYGTLAGGGVLDTTPAPGSGALAAAAADWARTAEAGHQLEHWADRLAPPWVALADGPGSRVPRGATRLADRLRSASCHTRVPADVVASVRAGARRHDLTEFMVLLTAYAATLRAWSGCADIRVGTQLANRARPETDGVVGLVANTVVLRMDVEEDADPVALAGQARRVCVEAFEHQEIPFEDVLAALAARHPAADRAGAVFEVMLVMQEEVRDVAVTAGTRFAPHRPDRGAPVTEIAATTSEYVLGVTPADGGLDLDLRYKPATTDRAGAERLLADIAGTLAATARALVERP